MYRNKFRAFAFAFFVFSLLLTTDTQAQYQGNHGNTFPDAPGLTELDSFDIRPSLLPQTIVFKVDVAEDFNTFVPTLVNPTDPEPGRGSFFVTEGRIYPNGTIQGDGSEFDPTPEGSIGIWFCRGTHLVTASEIPAAPFWVDTAQLYYLPDDARSISTDGLEGGGTIRRSVIGGTGLFAGYTGEQIQEFLGFNSTGGVNLRVTFVLRKTATP